jgi:hypothetical protein
VQMWEEDGNSRHVAAPGKHMHGNHTGQESHLELQDVDIGPEFGWIDTQETFEIQENVPQHGPETREILNSFLPLAST